jgi:hypothetical protein
MGCRGHHKRAQSNKRSTEYYQDEAGKEKKKGQNEKRSAKGRSPPDTLAPVMSSVGAPIKKYIEFLIRLLAHGRMTQFEVNQVYEGIQSELRQHTFENFRK